MKTIPLPEKIQFHNITDKKSELIFEPLFPGYGTTLGNTLRRVLLSSIPGAAVTAIKIKGVDHEFATIPGVLEDAIEIILRFKKLRMKIFENTDEEIRLHLKVDEEGIVKAGQIDKNSAVEIINTDFALFTVTDAKKPIEMDIFVKKGFGYYATEQRTDREEVGVIDIDSIFVPLVNVGYKIENVRVGEMTNFDKLILTVETDGTITAEEACAYAADTLIMHLHLMTKSNLKEALAKQDEERRAKVAVEPSTADEHVVEVAEAGLTAGAQEESPIADESTQEKKKRGRPKKTE
ncbi:MAG: DNA-directed RNA polymerase subunit alpha [Parcubacteria group bacterium]|nr:DNA-directed RNA polymerase subunit alpha [Parcubacteria group bacterium]